MYAAKGITSRFETPEEHGRLYQNGYKGSYVDAESGSVLGEVC